ncbi:NAD(P)/FAD-dependent oxidoreductase [Streptomyces sp. SB3404]|uniref:NAD(P)/FAD-dependent oxidoreductase n=1 Tax=Streptomyces boncukensis TaxID=2711219 RepID=A0A6G4WRD7_9ACTN|nr:FAD-dependent oxidoreductase [Streptomyces boncukensis]NGO67187.1 NAD(P)/FAD-dependent oxidoreductase [Streptomyces boncukensis]
MPAVVIGAGPYGLSAAAHLRARGVPTRVFGEPMASWSTHMPAGMLLKSTADASDIDAPRPGHTLADYCRAAGEPPCASDWDLVPGETFTRYGRWFQRELVPGLERVRVVAVDRGPGGGFEVKLDSGESCAARAVVVATGLTGCAYLPPQLAAAVPGGPTPAGPVSHSSQHPDPAALSGRAVLVVGAGQSALETAVLAAEAGAAVRVVARGRAAVGFGAPPDRQPRLRPRSPFGRAWSLYAFAEYAGAFRFLPAPARHALVRRVLGPLGAWWLRERFTERVRVVQGRALVRAGTGPGGRGAELELAGGAVLAADHIIAATGYRVHLAAMDFLGHELRAALARSGRAPVPLLGAGLESSVPGLYFTGLPAAASYGPLMRFVAGTRFASRRIAASVADG